MSGVDFRDIDINEELAIAEAGDMVIANDLVDRVEARRKSLGSGINLPWGKLDGLVSLAPGGMVLLGGYSGHFKSTISSQIGLAALQQGYNVGVASLELLAEDVIEQYAELAAVNQDPPMDFVRRFADYASNRLFIYDRVDAIRPDEAIQMVIAFAKYKNCKLIVLDALMMMGVCDDLERERLFTQTIAAVAKKFNVTVLLVHHVRKPPQNGGEQQIPGKYDFIGSSHLVNIASQVFICWHDKAHAAQKRLVEQGMDIDNFDSERRDMIFRVAKQRYAKFESSVSLWAHPRCRGFCGSSRRQIEPVDFTRQAA